MKGIWGSVLRLTGITSSPVLTKLPSDEEIRAQIYEEGAKEEDTVFVDGVHRTRKNRGDPYFCGPYSDGHKPPESIETQCERCNAVTNHQRRYKGGYMDYDGHCEWYYYQCDICHGRWFYLRDTVTEVTNHELTRDHGEHTDNP